MTNDLLAPALAAGAGAAAGSATVAASGFTAVGAVGGGAGIGAPAGPVGVAIGVSVGLAVYGVSRVVGDTITKGAYYAHLNGLRDTAPTTGPAQFSCLHCGHQLWPTKPAPFREWATKLGSTRCTLGGWHDAQPLVWKR